MSASSETSGKKIRQQLNRILGSKSFEGAERLKRFFGFIVGETLEGRGDQLKEFVVGEYVFEKGASFDPRNDPIVRVQARRLRARLTRYYHEEGPSDEIVIELPKGGYVPIFRRREAPPPVRAVAPVLVSRNSVVVLPFEDHSQDGTLKYLCRSISQEIINVLTKLETVTVSSQPGARSSEALERTHLNAATIVSGSLQKAGNQLRITTQFIDGASGRYLWSETMDAKANDNPFDIQEKIAHAVLDKVQAELSDTGWKMRSRQKPRNLAAYNLYQQGLYHLNQRTEEGLQRAVGFFEKVIAEDPQYAQAYAGLATSYELLGNYGVITPVEVWTKAPSNAGMAVLLDDTSSEAHTALAHVKSTQDWDWKGSEQEFLRALELDPRNSTAHHMYANCILAPMGRLEEALEQMQTANALDPISSIISRDLAVMYYYRREFEVALEQCDHTIELNPHFSPAYWMLGLIQEQRGDFDESIAAFKRAIQLSPQSPRMKGALGRSLALSGKRSEAEQILKELHDLAATRYISPFEFASIYFSLSQPDAGFEWLRKAFKDRCFELLAIKVDPRFDSLKNHPIFTELAGQLGLP
jgi:TolB-like protein/Flp pilus assembly protein TadD